jgi:hypothetical protein
MVGPFGNANLARFCLRTHLTLLYTSTDGHCPEFTRSLRTACMRVACQVESSAAGFTVHGTGRSEGESGLCSLQQLSCAGVQEVSKGISMLDKFLIFQPIHVFILVHVSITSLLHVAVCCIHHLQGVPLISCTTASAVYCVLCVLHWLCCRL